MAVYSVTNKTTKAERLVETRTKASAINYIASGEYEATALNTSDLVKKIQTGMTVETVKEEVEKKKPDGSDLDKNDQSSASLLVEKDSNHVGKLSTAK